MFLLGPGTAPQKQFVILGWFGDCLGSLGMDWGPPNPQNPPPTPKTLFLGPCRATISLGGLARPQKPSFWGPAGPLTLLFDVRSISMSIEVHAPPPSNLVETRTRVKSTKYSPTPATSSSTYARSLPPLDLGLKRLCKHQSLKHLRKRIDFCTSGETRTQIKSTEHSPAQSTSLSV